MALSRAHRFGFAMAAKNSTWDCRPNVATTSWRESSTDFSRGNDCYTKERDRMTYTSLGLLTAAVALVACASPKPTAPAPQLTKTSRPVSDVVAIAAQTLTDLGFEVTVSDATAGLLTAKREQRGKRDGTVCSWARTSRTESSANTRIIVVNLTARPDSNQTAVSVTSRVRVSVPSLSIDSDDDCVSDGTIETKVLDALIPVRR
jgi:hypothetical protein